MQADDCSPENEQRAWHYCRTPPDVRFPKEYEVLKKLSYDNVRIRFLGVFDTVGSLGVPVGAFTRRNRKRFQFHDVMLGSNLDYGFTHWQSTKSAGRSSRVCGNYPTTSISNMSSRYGSPGFIPILAEVMQTGDFRTEPSIG